jgi:alpha-D-ribose 1-methylphosphonate 5-triphosphate synthase subunit PhnH
MPKAIAGLTMLGVAEAADVLFLSGNDTALWDGQTVDATTVIVKYTYVGDADLNGYVDAADYGVIDNFIQFPGASGYFNGDFNFDGVIDAADYGHIDNSIQLQGAPL